MCIPENFKFYIYKYMGCLCGSIFMESSDLGLWEGYVWFLHNVSLNLREFGGLDCLLNWFFVCFLVLTVPSWKQGHAVSPATRFSHSQAIPWYTQYLDPVQLFPTVFAAVAGAYLQWFSWVE